MPIALLSVSDKTGLVDFARALCAQGYTLLSTGGTARAIRAAGVEVTLVSDHTGHPEVMNGRVKTLHPRIHGGILGLRDVHAAEAEAHDIPWIDLVVVNLYPFEQTMRGEGASPAEVIEQIDIGGPSMVRSAAKNHAFVSIITNPEDYSAIMVEIENGGVGLETRKRLALKAFQHTAAYDAVISAWLAEQNGPPRQGETTPADGGAAGGTSLCSLPSGALSRSVAPCPLPSGPGGSPRKLPKLSAFGSPR
jgi:phosphoribosylaminoimidazolecarboxamide formyltransferase/IMP cyclohydrolase